MYRILVSLERDGWHIDYELKDQSACDPTYRLAGYSQNVRRPAQLAMLPNQIKARSTTHRRDTSGTLPVVFALGPIQPKLAMLARSVPEGTNACLSGIGP